MARILITEDNPDIAFTLERYLLAELHIIEVARDGIEAAQILRSSDFDLLILDWNLPGKSGVEVCREYRLNGGSKPVLLLTAKSSSKEKIAGLDSGADDYLTKPFDLGELSARVRALLRRSAGPSSDLLVAGDLKLDTGRHTLKKGALAISLLSREYQLLEFLMRNPQHVFSAEALLDRVWPSDSDASKEAVKSTLVRLRKKVDPKGELIKTVHGVGYIFEPNDIPS